MAVLIDGHVHLYPEFSTLEFFDAVFANFHLIRDGQNLPTDSDYAIFLTEGGDHDMFSKLFTMTELRDEDGSQRFTIERCPGQNSLLVKKDDVRLYVFRGRQHVSEEKIELLSLFSREAIKDRSLSLQTLAQKVAESNGIVVIPWGVGKWFGKRGKTIKKFLEQEQKIPFFLGDSGNRPLFWPTPSLFAVAANKGVQLLSGSDPLPLRSHYKRAVSTGTMFVEGSIAPDNPEKSLRELFLSGINGVEFGLRQNPFAFFYDQLYINVLKRFF